MVTINGLVDLVADVAGKRIEKVHIDGPTGVRGRNSDNRLIDRELGWRPSKPLSYGIERTYRWIEEQVSRGTIDPK
jgi:nucleoside-diphosphate-sugar epimerase